MKYSQQHTEKTTWHAWHTDKMEHIQFMVYRKHGIQTKWYTDNLHTAWNIHKQNEIKNETYKKTTQKENIENKTNMQKLQDGIIKIILPLEQELDELKVLEQEEYNPSTVH